MKKQWNTAVLLRGIRAHNKADHKRVSAALTAMKNIAALLCVLSLSAHSAGGEMDKWPALDGVPFISGRSATEADVDNGSAAFVLKSDDSYIGSPLDIEIPQYALHYIEGGGAEQVIVIQAEEAQGQKVVGAIEVTSGQYLAGLLHEFELLGSDAGLAVKKRLQSTVDASAE